MPRPESWFVVGRTIIVHDKMQSNYHYTLVKPMGDFSDYPDFQPELTPTQMLHYGVFEGKYLNDCTDEFPLEWFVGSPLSEDHRPHVELNFFRIKSRQSLSEWKRKQWIVGHDVRGWFQWYCRFFIGRRDSSVDALQVKRWKAFKRHRAQLQKNCVQGDASCRPKQRQALLQWAYDPLV